MFAATDVLYPRRLRDVQLFNAFQINDIKSAATLSGAHLDLYKKARPGEPDSLMQFLDRCLSLLPYQAIEQPQFEHLPVHDAESVYKLIALFFLRARVNEQPDEPGLQERSAAFMSMTRHTFGEGQDSELNIKWQLMSLNSDLEPFVPMLQAMNEYFKPAWYGMDESAQTGRGQPFEFHAHMFLQRLLMKEIVRLRHLDQPVDERGPIDEINVDIDRPLRIVARTATGTGGSHHLRCLKAAIAELKADTEDPHTYNLRDSPIKFPEEVYAVQIDRQREMLWYAIGEFGDKTQKTKTKSTTQSEQLKVHEQQVVQ